MARVLDGVHVARRVARLGALVGSCVPSVRLTRISLCGRLAHSPQPKPRSPSNLVAAVPYPYNGTGHAIYGWGDSGGITPHPSDGHFYVAMNNRMAVGLQSNGTCVMRTASLIDPRSWRAWDGTGFNVELVSAYTLPPGERPAHVCTVLQPFMATPCTVYGTAWSVYLGAFVAALSCWHDAQPGPNDPRFFWATSPDFVHWSVPQVLYDPPAEPHTQFYLYPALLDAGAPARGDAKYATLGQTATLTFVRVTDNFYTEGRQVLGVNVSFSGGGGGAAASTQG